MGKGDRRTKAKRAQRDFADAMPALEPVQRKQPNGRARRDVEDRNKATENLKARCRQMGLEITKANMREVRAPWWGCAAGRVIANETMGETERQDLWGAIREMRKITAAYDAALGVPNRHPACMRLLTPVDETSADATTPPKDTRTDEEKQRQATAAWTRMHGWLSYTDGAARSEALRVVLDDGSAVDRQGLLLALRCVRDGMQGKRLSYRGRA